MNAIHGWATTHAYLFSVANSAMLLVSLAAAYFMRRGDVRLLRTLEELLVAVEDDARATRHSLDQLEKPGVCEEIVVEDGRPPLPEA